MKKKKVTVKVKRRTMAQLRRMKRRQVDQVRAAVWALFAAGALACEGNGTVDNVAKYADDTLKAFDKRWLSIL